MLTIKSYSTKKCPVNKIRAEFRGELNVSFLALILPAVKFVRDIESSTYRVVILCKLIRMGPIVLFETSIVRLIEYSISRYRDSIVSELRSFCGILNIQENLRSALIIYLSRMDMFDLLKSSAHFSITLLNQPRP